MRNTRLPDRTAGRGAPLPRGALLHARARRRCGAAHAAPGELGSSSALARLVRARLIRARLELGYPSLGDVAVPAADALLGHLAGLRSGEARTRRRRRRLLRRQEGGADTPHHPPRGQAPARLCPVYPRSDACVECVRRRTMWSSRRWPPSRSPSTRASASATRARSENSTSPAQSRGCALRPLRRRPCRRRRAGRRPSST